MKKCTKCQKELDLSCFYKTRKKYLTPRCKKCLQEDSLKYIEKYRQGETYKKYSIKQNRKRREKRLQDPEYRIKTNSQKKDSIYKNFASFLLTRTKSRCKTKNIDFNLTLEDIIIPEKCPLLEIPFIIGNNKNYAYTPSVDRIDPTKGYVKGNVRIISMLANTMKSNATKEQLELFCKNILKYIENNEIVQPIEN